MPILQEVGLRGRKRDRHFPRYNTGISPFLSRYKINHVSTNVDFLLTKFL